MSQSPVFVMHKLLIAGELSEASSGETMGVTNPATGEVIDTVSKGTVEDTKRAIDAAEEAFKIWSEISPLERSGYILRATDLISQHLEELATSLTMEQGKTLAEARAEIKKYVATFRYYATLGQHLRGSYRELSERGKHALIIKKPIGVSGAILPFNNPVLMMGDHCAPALIVGNTVVIKPASTTPLTDLRCAELFLQTGLPKGVMNIVPGSGSVVGEELLRNPKVRKISFTGETETGKHIMEMCAKQIKRVSLNLGGSDPVIVCEDADLDKAAEGVALGRFRNAGQGCMCAKRLFLSESISEKFLKLLFDRVGMIRVGNGLRPETRMGPIHTANQRAEVEDQVVNALDRGAKVLTGGARPRGEEYDRGFFYLPTILTSVDPASTIAKEECFGPALPVFEFADLKDAVHKANDSIYGLASSIWTKDINRAMWAGEHIQAGLTWINSYQGDVSFEVPRGGFKHSRLGVEGGIEALDYFTETKTIQIRGEFS